MGWSRAECARAADDNNAPARAIPPGRARAWPGSPSGPRGYRAGMSDDQLLPHLEMTPEDGPVTGSIIWLHGLGADGNDFAPLFEHLALPGIRIILPHAPSIPVTLNGGMSMPAWYDIETLDREAPPDLVGMRRSAAQAGAFITHEIARGVPSERIVLGGFSQGGAVSLWAGTRESRPLAGIAGLSTWLVDRNSLAAERAEENLATSVYMGHGTLDMVVPFHYGKLSAEHLREHGHQVRWFESDIDHSVGLEELRELASWFREVLD